MPYHDIFSTTLLLYKLDTLLLKQKNLPVLDITGFFFHIRTQVTALVLHTSAFTWVLMRKKKPVISNTGRFFCFNSTVSYTCPVWMYNIMTIFLHQELINITDNPHIYPVYNNTLYDSYFSCSCSSIINFLAINYFPA